MDGAPRLAVHDGRIFAVWTEEEQDLETGEADVYFAVSDNGVTFSKALNLSAGVGAWAIEPQIAVAGNFIYVIWSDNETPRTTGTNQVYVSRSTDGGSTFDAPVKLSDDGLQPQLAHGPENKLCAVWVRPYPASGVYAAFSGDGGDTFAPPEALSTSAFQVSEPQVAVDTSGSVHVVWSQQVYYGGNSAVVYRRLVNSQTGFEPAQWLSGSSVSAYAARVGVHGSTGRIHVVWTEGTGSATGEWSRFIGSATSTNGGESFSTAGVGQAADNSFPELAVASDGRVQVVWARQGDMMFAQSLHGGITFSDAQIIGSSLVVALPRIASASPRVTCVVWEGQADGNPRVFSATSEDGGVTFSTQNLTPDHAASPNADRHAATTPAIAADAGTAFVAWIDDRYGRGKMVGARSK